ncbi:MAG: DUF488 domain-containing protein [Gammaproteobacteria bacterium]|nr:DUF488 domain-containing protein [Gammaproteobacteria bacterium]
MRFEQDPEDSATGPQSSRVAWCGPGRGPPVIYSIGHSNHDLRTFVALLQGATIDAVADVRSAPFSRFNPQFNNRELARALRATGIAYVYLGQLLGGRPADPDCYVNGRLDPLRLVGGTPFQRGIQRLLVGASRYRVAIMCAEREPRRCHRHHLITPVLVAAGARVIHILHDGRLREAEVEAPIVGSRSGDLFDEV